MRCSCSAACPARCTTSPPAAPSRSRKFIHDWSSCSASLRNTKWMRARCDARRDPIWSAMPPSCARRRAGARAARSTISCETSSMPKRTDLARILLLGSGPIVIGQAAEFGAAMKRIGLATPAGRTVTSVAAALEVVQDLGYPAIIRPSYTLGGTGGGVAYNRAEFEELVERALELSPVHSTLIEHSVLGWKEFELEVMRDRRDNVVIVCSIENVDPMGVHTGGSITRPSAT